MSAPGEHENSGESKIVSPGSVENFSTLTSGIEVFIFFTRLFHLTAVREQ